MKNVTRTLRSKPSGEVHVTSLVVHANPETWQRTIDAVRRLPSAEVHVGQPIGKFVVVLETDDEQQILHAIDRINEIDGVYSASMVYHHIDDPSVEALEQ